MAEVRAQLERHTDWLVPFSKPRNQYADARQFRSTWLTASRTTLRELGYGAAYEAALDPVHREAILGAVPGVWLPMAVARAHYEAADKLDLTESQVVAIGIAATRRSNATMLSFMSRLAQGAGVTPWTALGYAPRLMANTSDGGAIAVARMGPKDAILELVGYPLASVRYNRIASRGIALGIIELFCKSAYAKQIDALTSAHTLGIRMAWV